jgi:hypothetical protein
MVDINRRIIVQGSPGKMLDAIPKLTKVKMVMVVVAGVKHLPVPSKC